MESLAERLTSQFYDWEKRGRGWTVFDSPVHLEPEFVPFFFHVVNQNNFIDDGRRPTLISRFFNLFQKELPVKNSNYGFADNSDIQAYRFECEESLKAFQVTLPKGYKVKINETVEFLTMLSYCNYPLSFEIIASSTKIIIQFVCRESDFYHVSSQLKAYFPESLTRDVHQSDILIEGKQALIIDYGLKDEFVRPLNMAKNFDLDPYTGLFGILENIPEGEQAAIQILFSGVVNSWSESILRSVTDNEGGHFFLDAPDMMPLAKEKVSSPLYGVTIRAIIQAETSDRSRMLLTSLSNALVQLTRSNGNSLIPLSDSGYDFQAKADDVLFRQSHRLGMLLNSQELATLVHFPSASIVSSKLEREIRKTKAAPQITKGHPFALGMNDHHGSKSKVSVDTKQRLKHTHIIGATGTGKSTLLLNFIDQDIQQGNGVAVLDPHGDLIESILSRIPAERSEDVILIDPSDSEYPVGFNILSAHSEIEKEILSSDLVAVFRRLSTSWGDQMNSVFANAILAFLESQKGGTLVDLRRFLVEKSYRDEYLKSVTDPSIVYYWQKEYPLLKSSSIGPILTRLDTFLRPKLIRNMVAQKKSFDFENILDTQKILLIKLSQGLMGAENSYLLGSFFVTKLYQAAMARQAKSKEERNDFFLYIDEFQNFITPSMSLILSGARKYHLGLILAHQDMQQLLKQDSELASSVISNAGTRICFRIGDIDAKKLESGFSFFEVTDLQNLNTGEAIGRIDRPEFDFNISTSILPEIDESEAHIRKNQVIQLSRTKYGTNKNEVEKFLLDSLGEFEITKTDIPKNPTYEKKTESIPKPKIQSVEIIESDVKENLVRKKEESQHRYLQTLIKRMAESRGYKATLEVPTENGKGLIDVVLERNEKRIACEITVTTTDTWELHNIQKCLSSGYETIVVCSTEKNSLIKIDTLINEKLNPNDRVKVHLFEPTELFIYLDQQIANDYNKEERVKGYRVKVEYNPVAPEVAKQKKDQIIKTIADSIRKAKEKNMK